MPVFLFVKAEGLAGKYLWLPLALEYYKIIPSSIGKYFPNLIPPVHIDVRYK